MTYAATITQALSQGHTEADVALVMAAHSHAGQTIKFGARIGQPYLMAHVLPVMRRVAKFGPDASAVALLHDTMEEDAAHILTEVDLRDAALRPSIIAAVSLLTRDPDEPYRLWIERLAVATNEAEWLAKMVKIADIEDHLSDIDPAHSLAKRYHTALNILTR